MIPSFQRERLFRQQMELGRLGEEFVVGFLRRRNCGVIPSYEFSGKKENKAPKLVFNVQSFVIPDIDVMAAGKRSWVEVKTFAEAPMNRLIGEPVHGINSRHYHNYLCVENESGSPVFLAVLELSSGELLVARLSSLRAMSCIGRHVHGTRCLTYFRRSEFRLWEQFSDSALSGVRERYQQIRSAKAVEAPVIGAWQGVNDVQVA